MKYFVFALAMLLSVACESKPVRKAPPSEKATKDKTLYSAELESEVTEAPKDASSLESSVTLNAGVQKCLRDAILKSGDDFSVEFEGEVTKKRQLSKVKVRHDYDSLRSCLEAELPKITLSEGSKGRFKMRISRVRVTPPKSKTFLLDLNDTKKLQ